MLAGRAALLSLTRDLFHVALDNIAAADAWLDAIGHSCRQLAGQTMMGRARPELAPELRSFAVRRYVVFYLPMPEGSR